MAYDHHQVEIPFLASGGDVEHSVSGAGEKGRITPTYQPFILRAVGVVALTTLAVVTAPVVQVRKVGTAGAASATGDVQATITLVTGVSQGKINYDDALDVEVMPGEELTLHVITAATQAQLVKASAFVEPRWENPANNTDMTDSGS